MSGGLDASPLLATSTDRGAGVTDALAARYIRDPVRLVAGAHLALTPEGAEAARRLQSARGDIA
jgi:hypothetical protein